MIACWLEWGAIKHSVFKIVMTQIKHNYTTPPILTIECNALLDSLLITTTHSTSTMSIAFMSLFCRSGHCSHTSDHRLMTTLDQRAQHYFRIRGSATWLGHWLGKEETYKSGVIRYGCHTANRIESIINFEHGQTFEK